MGGAGTGGPSVPESPESPGTVPETLEHALQEEWRARFLAAAQGAAQVPSERVIDSGLVGRTDFVIVTSARLPLCSSGEGHKTRRCRKAFRLFDSKGHLPRVVNHQVYNVYYDYLLTTYWSESAMSS